MEPIGKAETAPAPFAVEVPGRAIRIGSVMP
jgi:hypothetical protein